MGTTRITLDLPVETAIIAGTGFIDLAHLQIIDQIECSTPFGPPSSDIYLAQLEDIPLYIVLRHGKPHRIAPHMINYRANLWALKELAIRNVVAINAVGAINAEFHDGSIVIPDQIIDYSYGREHTFFDGAERREISQNNDCDDSACSLIASTLQHVDFSQPYTQALRQQLIAAAEHIKLRIHCHGVCGVTQGPRLESAAEIIRLQRDGCDIVGMTSMPEAGLARELELNYASIALVVNKAAGLSEQAISLEAIKRVADKAMLDIIDLLKCYLGLNNNQNTL